MYKLIDKIPENIPEDKIEKKIINYKQYEYPYKTIIKDGMVLVERGASEFFINTFIQFGLPLPFFRGNDAEIKSLYDFYMTDSFGLIPKKWIDGKKEVFIKEVFIYDDSDDEYFHLIVGEYKENL
ncbi:hypothetical protein [Brachyspira sp.]|uniref:hypothetical protein n=1 Tax=Brachyspira sp. TaxID=1977261 RepID=UPI003D7C40F5